MKKFVFSLVFSLTASTAAYAQNAAVGALVEHPMACDIPVDASGRPVLGGAYSMSCATRALQPQNSLQSCNLFVTVISPNAQPRRIELSISTQSPEKTELRSESEKITVDLDQSNFSAQARFDNGVSFKCHAYYPQPSEFN